MWYLGDRGQWPNSFADRNRFDVNDTIIHTSIALHRKKSLHLTPYKAAEEKTVMIQSHFVNSRSENSSLSLILIDEKMWPVQIPCVIQSKLWALLNPPGTTWEFQAAKFLMWHTKHSGRQRESGSQKKWEGVRKGFTLFHFYFVSTRVKIKTYKLVMKLKWPAEAVDTSRNSSTMGYGIAKQPHVHQWRGQVCRVTCLLIRV